MAELPDARHALSLQWVFGVAPEAGAHSLSDENRSAIFYTSAHTGVVLDLQSQTQLLLQGHRNAICATAASEDRRRIATADAGPGSMLVLWDSYNGCPLRSIAPPHKSGVRAIDMSPDARYVVALSAGPAPQLLSLWDLAADGDKPLYSHQVDSTAEEQLSVRFSPEAPTEIVTAGGRIVIFWSWASGTLECYAPEEAGASLQQPVSPLTGSLFLPGSRRALSSTTDGQAVVWDVVSNVPEADTLRRRAVKLVRLASRSTIRCAVVMHGLLFVGTADGHVRAFNSELRLVAWFEDIAAGPVTSISFSHDAAAWEGKGGADDLRCADFIVGTAGALIVACSSAMFGHPSLEARRGTLLVQGQEGAVHGLAAHPALPRFASTCGAGLLHLWDFEERRLLLLRLFDGLSGHILAFSPDGALLAVGFTNGTLKLLSATSLQELHTFRNFKGCVRHLCFSADGTWLAAAATDRAVALYRFGPNATDPEKHAWELIGRHRAHAGAVTALAFSTGEDAASARLISCGEDRMLCEYDLGRASVQDGLQLRKRTRLEQTAAPTACAWVKNALDAGPSLVVANDAYKLRIVASDSLVTCRTILGPTHGGPLLHLRPLPHDPELAAASAELRAELRDDRPGKEAADGAGAGPEGAGYVAYACEDKVAGLVRLPLDGNPNASMGLIAHPGEVSSLVASPDGRWLITAGGSDASIHLWRVDTDALDAAATSGGTGADAFAAQLDGGKGGPVYSELVDYFCYAELRALGEETTEERHLTGRVPLSEIGNLLRACGHYPTEREVDDIVHEVAAGGADSVDFDSFLRIYINHRPAVGISNASIAAAFDALGANNGGGCPIPTSELLRVLQSHGEAIAPDDLAQCLRALCGVSSLDEAFNADCLDAKAFAETVLGFEVGVDA